LNYIEDLYESTATPRPLMLQNKFYKLTMQDDINMLNFLFTAKILLIQIVGIGNVIKDEDVVLIILNVYQNLMKVSCKECQLKKLFQTSIN
jgi:hypothetical protein